MISFFDFDEDNLFKNEKCNYSDCKEESENAINYLKKNLLKNNLYNKYKTYISNINYINIKI